MMDKEVEAELKAKLKQLPMPEKIKCCALYKHLKEVYDAENECDTKNRKIIYDFNEENKHYLQEITDIMNGNVELTDELLEGKEEFFTAEELEKKEYLNTTAIEGFYLSALKKNPMLKDEIKSNDEPILKQLKNIELELFADKDDFTLKFNFGTNEFFQNTVLTVNVVMNENGQCSEIKSDTINWNEGKDVTKKTITKKQKNKKTGVQRTTTKVQKQDSFFSVFKSHKEDDEDSENDEAAGGEDEDELKDPFGFAEEVFGLIKENVVPYASAAYFGVTIPELEMDGDADDDDDDDDYEDEDDDEEDEDPKNKKKSVSSKKGTSTEDSKGENQQECKQN